jgi:excisionase family DNA binding protein
MGGEYLSIREVAERLQISRRRAYAIAEAGVIPSIRLTARRIVVPIEAWETWRRAQVDMALSRCGEVAKRAS